MPDEPDHRLDVGAAMPEAPALRLPDHVGLQRFVDGRTMAVALAERVAAALTGAIAERGEASLVVAGGRSPVAFFNCLSGHALDWARVTVTLVDERWLPPAHSDSNAGLVQAELLRANAVAARLVPLYGGEATPENGLSACAKRLASIARPFDVVVLGMGEDGHFASLFPGAESLSELLSESGPVLAAVHPPRAAHARVSLGLSALLDTRVLLVQIQGARKAAVIEAGAAPDADAMVLPIAALLRQRRTPFRVFYAAAP